MKSYSVLNKLKVLHREHLQNFKTYKEVYHGRLIMESVREGSKTKHKTIHFVGSSAKPEVISALEKISQRMIVKLSEERQPALPGMAEAIYSKEPQYLNKKPKPKQQEKTKTFIACVLKAQNR